MDLKIPLYYKLSACERLIHFRHIFISKMGQSSAYRMRAHMPHTMSIPVDLNDDIWGFCDGLPLTTEIHLCLSTNQNKKVCQCNSISFHNIQDF